MGIDHRHPSLTQQKTFFRKTLSKSYLKGLHRTPSYFSNNTRAVKPYTPHKRWEPKQKQAKSWLMNIVHQISIHYCNITCFALITPRKYLSTLNKLCRWLQATAIYVGVRGQVSKVYERTWEAVYYYMS